MCTSEGVVVAVNNTFMALKLIHCPNKWEMD